jgi:hypothetical protein
LAIDEATMALKLGDAIGKEKEVELTAAETAGVVAGMRIASINIEAPHFHVHPMRQ